MNDTAVITSDAPPLMIAATARRSVSPSLQVSSTINTRFPTTSAGAAEVLTAVSFKTGSYKPDFYGFETEAAIVLPWDREQIVDGELRPNPKYAGLNGG